MLSPYAQQPNSSCCRSVCGPSQPLPPAMLILPAQPQPSRRSQLHSSTTECRFCELARTLMTVSSRLVLGSTSRRGHGLSVRGQWQCMLVGEPTRGERVGMCIAR